MLDMPVSLNENQIDSTIIWGKLQNPLQKLDISVIFLNSNSSHLRTKNFENLLNCGFKSIISVEPHGNNFNIENLSLHYPAIKFLIPRQKAGDGQLINACISEIDGKYILVLRDTLNIPAGFLLKNLAAHLTKENVYCIVPRLFDYSGESLDICSRPFAQKGRFEVETNSIITDSMHILYPFDNIGLFNREKFMQLGGYDCSIKSSYWQNLDLSLRAWLWGEKIIASTAFAMNYIEEAPIKDSTVDVTYLKFYLKNQLPHFVEDHGEINKTAFFTFFRNSSCGFFESLRQFESGRKWVEKNKYRFKRDLQDLIENWGEDYEKK